LNRATEEPFRSANYFGNDSSIVDNRGGVLIPSTDGRFRPAAHKGGASTAISRIVDVRMDDSDDIVLRSALERR
jgi:hypothetical protein